MSKIGEILRQRYEVKCSVRDIARSLNIGTGTVTNYLKRAKVAGLVWPLPKDLSEEALYERLFLPVDKDVAERQHPEWAKVHRELRRKGVTLLLLWREYREAEPSGLGYSQFCFRYREYSKSVSPVMRQVYKAGDRCFVDYAGMTVPWLDVTTNTIQEAQIFVGSLGASQYTFAEATATQKLEDWIQSHINMFSAFKGVPNVVVPDNLKSGVQRAHLYDPDINQNYQAFGEHYGFAIVPARVRKPQDKAKVESAVGCIEREILAPLRHYTFTSIAEINSAIQKRLAHFLDRPFQKMATSRRQLYELLDKPELKPLPAEPYEYAEWATAKVHIDYHFLFDRHYYSVPYQFIHKPIKIRATTKTIECFHQGARIAAHPRSFRHHGHTTLTVHMPEAHRVQAEWSVERLHRWASKIGPHTAAFIKAMIAARKFPEQAYRACLGVLRLANKFTDARLEQACAKALVVGASRYQQIESILKHNLEHQMDSAAVTVTIQDHKNIRGPGYYQ